MSHDLESKENQVFTFEEKREELLARLSTDDKDKYTKIMDFEKNLDASGVQTIEDFKKLHDKVRDYYKELGCTVVFDEVKDTFQQLILIELKKIKYQLENGEISQPKEGEDELQFPIIVNEICVGHICLGYTGYVLENYDGRRVKIPEM